MSELHPVEQAIFHAGCATRHSVRAVAALWHFQPARVCAVAGLAAIIAIAAGCKRQPPTIVAPEASSMGTALSKAAAAVGAAKYANEQNPDGLPKVATDKELGIAAQNLPPPKVQDKAEAIDRVALVLAGKLDEATKRYAQAESEAAQLRAQIARERAESEQLIKQIVADADAKVAAAKAEANRQAYLRVVSVFSIIGGAIAVAGVVCAVTGWSRIGILGIPAGVLIGGSGLLWGRPWFTYTAGIGVLLCAVGFGIWWAVQVHETRKKQAQPTE